MSVESDSTEFHLINDGGIKRKVAYSRLGELNAKHIFLCLPGLLETRESFHPLLDMVEQFDDCCWISIDYCGRGNSDQLPASEQYAFSKYLADTEDLIETLIQSKKLNSKNKHGRIIQAFLTRNYNKFVSFVCEYGLIRFVLSRRETMK